MKYLTQTLAVLLVAAAPATAQTARIAHASHSGSPATLAADASSDNYGMAPVLPRFLVDSVKLLSDTTALEYGNWHKEYDTKIASEKSRTVRFARRPNSNNILPTRAGYLERLKRSGRPVKLIGDTLPAVNTPAPAPPIKIKTKRKYRQAMLSPPPTVPGGPTLPGGLLLAAGVLLLAGAGWLMAAPDKRPVVPA